MHFSSWSWTRMSWQKNVCSVLVPRGPLSPPDGTSWSWSTSEAKLLSSVAMGSDSLEPWPKGVFRSYKVGGQGHFNISGTKLWFVSLQANCCMTWWHLKLSFSYKYLLLVCVYSSRRTDRGGRLVFLSGFQKGRAQFRPKKAICIVARKNVKKFEKLIEFHSF
jgi:hypothetical protein